MKLSALFVAVWIALAAVPAHAQDAMEPAQFRDHVIAAAKAQNNTYLVEITGPLSFKIDEGLVNLDSGYSEYRDDPTQLDNVVRRWVQMFSMMAEGAGVSSTDLSQRLVMLVRNRLYVDGAPADLEPGKAPVWRPLGGDAVVLLMADYPTMRGSVTQDLLTEAKLSPDEAWRIAKANSIAAMGTIQMGAYGTDGPLAVTAESGLATSILADPDACADGPFANGAVVLIVDRDTFVYADPADPETIKPFWTLAREAVQSGGYASSTPLTCRGGAWRVAALPG